MRGLIGADPVYPVYFTTRLGIHTFGVLSPIDVLILDKNNRVVKVRKGLLPNRVFFWNPMYKNVIEMPAGTIVRKHISVGSAMLLQV